MSLFGFHKVPREYKRRNPTRIKKTRRISTANPNLSPRSSRSKNIQKKNNVKIINIDNESIFSTSNSIIKKIQRTKTTPAPTLTPQTKTPPAPAPTLTPQTKTPPAPALVPQTKTPPAPAPTPTSQTKPNEEVLLKLSDLVHSLQQTVMEDISGSIKRLQSKVSTLEREYDLLVEKNENEHDNLMDDITFLLEDQKKPACNIKGYVLESTCLFQKCDLNSQVICEVPEGTCLQLKYPQILSDQGSVWMKALAVEKCACLSEGFVPLFLKKDESHFDKDLCMVGHFEV